MTDAQLRIKQTGLIGRYLPIKMVFALAFFCAFITYMRGDLETRFLANPGLNSLIIATMCVSIGLAFYNIAKIRFAAMFLQRLEAYEDAPTAEMGLKLVRGLRRKGKVINTFYMEGAILSLTEPGYLKFSDNQSRIMKSKVGQRTSRMRHGVQYLAGVLVMLGLIGTFWGLLETITSVGEAMATIVDSFAKNNAGEGGDGNAMVGFLKAISKPLQGMGIAFSASLFGLSGSLFTGLLNSFCGKGMDRFLEDFSNWIDARIPLAPEKAKEARSEVLSPMDVIERHNQVVVHALEEALSSFGKQTQHMFSMFSELIGEMTEFGTQQTQLTRQLTAEKRETMRLASSFESGINALSSHLSGMHESLAMLPAVSKEMRSDLRGISSTISSTQAAIVNHQQLSGDQMAEYSRQQAVLTNSLNSLFEGNRAMAGMHGRIAEALESLHDDTVTQKDKIIEMVLVMQHILQSQLDPKLELKSNPLLDSNKSA
jgi:hypothetical protein